VQLTVGTRRVFRHFSGFEFFSVSTARLPSHPPQLTQAVGRQLMIFVNCKSIDNMQQFCQCYKIKSMDSQYNLSQSSKAVINFALLFLWILLLIGVFFFLATVFALITGQAILYRAVIVWVGIVFVLLWASTILLPIVNQYNRIRVTEEGLYVEVYVFRYFWKFISWDEILELKFLVRLDRWGKPQWLLRVRNLTYWHRWISWHHWCGSDPGILIHSDLINRDKLLDVIEEKLSERMAKRRK
jgi:hypothetical protein